MNTFAKRTLPALVAMLALLARMAVAAPPAPLKLPDFEALAAKAAQSVNITLDSNLLSLAAGFLDSSKPEDAAGESWSPGCAASMSGAIRSTRTLSMRQRTSMRYASS